MRTIYKKRRLSELHNPQCRLCPLYKSSKHVCILGRGMLDAPVFLIGEAPGQAEEKYGKPFCGRAGKFLDSLLIKARLYGLVYISNVCHCRPPNNRKPNEAEAEICWPYTLKEISIIQPKVVVLLGRTAMDIVGLDRSMRGDHYYDNKLKAQVVSTWHPAYCLRKGGDTIRDLQIALDLSRRLLQ